MNVNIVAPYESHAMHTLIDPLLSDKQKPAWLTYTISAEPDWSADLNYAVPLNALLNTPIKGKTIAHFTHVNPGQEAAVKSTADACSKIICMTRDGERELKALGVTTPTTVIPAPVDPIFKPRKRNIIVVGSEQPNGRKRSWFLLDLAWSHDLSPFHFIIVGAHWDGVVEMLENQGVSVEYHPSVPREELVTLYQKSDALLVTGYKEGGPLPVLEALACGLPVIAPKYGYAADKVVNNYETMNEAYKHLALRTNLVKALATDRVAEHTAENYRDLHYSLFQDSFDIPVLSRYDWLTKIISETKPKTIMEIGTCRGDSAERMIAEASKHNNPWDIFYFGFDLFTPLTAEQMEKERSKQPADQKSVWLRLLDTGANITLYEGDTKLTLPKGPNRHIDFIFVDGGHSWETIESDWNNLQRYIGPNTTILFDDYYLGGHDGTETGCQHLMDSIVDSGKWNVQLLQPVESWPQADGTILKIAMVKVTRRK
jgi:predicted O-methyltransferase YrrM